MRTNYVKRKLKAGQPSVGTWLGLADPTAARFLARVGFDWLNVDMEHNPISIETAAAMFGAIADTGTCPLARIPWNTAENVKRVLDCGAWGIVVPMVNSREEAEAAVAAAKHPTVGIRSIGGSLHALNFATDTATYYARANDEILVVIQAEHYLAVERADEIFSVPGVDAVFIGPNDLLASMGRPPSMETEDEEFVQALEHIRVTAQKYGVAPGLHVSSAEAANRRIEEGFRFVAIASDIRFMVGQAQAALKGLTHPDAATGSAGEIARY
jgi:4-hydroxy-2-oxoheptanedioate aldolase